MAIIKQRIERINLDDNVCEGGWIDAWVNPPLGLLEDIQTTEIKSVYKQLGKLIKGWNFYDEKGDPILRSEANIRNVLPTDVVMEIITKIADRVASPNPPRSAGS